MSRVEPDRPFLRFQSQVFSYGDALSEAMRTEPRPVASLRLDPTSVFATIATISRGSLVVPTSGTTGRPREVGLTPTNLEAASRASAAHLGHGPEDDWLLAMPLRHVGGLSIIVRQAYCGGSITMLDRFDPEPFAAAMKGRVTMVSVVPTMLRRLLPLGPFGGHRAVLVGGGPIPAGLLEEARAAGLPALPTYGMTETVGQLATLRPSAPLQYAVHPLPGVEVVIRDDGRISVRGEQVAPAATGADGWLVTNDVGEWADDGAFRILGRTDNVIVSGGVNVYPEQIETALAPHVEEVVVIGMPDPEWGEMVVCIYVGDGEVEEVAADILSGPYRPKRFMRVESIPKIGPGKPDRRALQSLL